MKTYSILIRRWLGIVFIFVASVAFSSVSHAQEDGSSAPAKVEEVASSTKDNTLLGAFKQGGLAMYPLLIFSIATFGLIIANAITIREKKIVNQQALNDEVGPALEELDFVRAMELCEANKGPLLNILYSGLETTQSGHFDPQAVDQAFNESASVELSGPYVNVNYLQVIASVSPMVGLLGTVSGMVKAFRTIAEQGMGRPELLADNISEALITTASGLMVAIPALIAYFYFKNRYGKIATSVSQVLGRTLRNITARIEQSHAEQPGV